MGAVRWYTVLCKMPDDPRGQYSEEIDVEARSHHDAMRKVKVILAGSQYEPLLRPVRVVPRPTVEVRSM